MKKICVELADLIEAFENECEDISYYLNLLNGEIVKVSVDYCADETVSQIDYNDPEKFFKINPIPPDAQLKLRENFLKLVTDENIRDKLEVALTHRGPLRKFAEIMKSYDDMNLKWKKFQEDSMKAYIRQWINSIDATCLNPLQVSIELI